MTLEENVFISPDNIYRDILLGLEIVISFFCLEFFLLFFSRYVSRSSKPAEISQDKKLSNYIILERLEKYLNLLKNRELSFVMFFFMVAMMNILFILGDFYSGNSTAREFFLYAGYLEFIFSFVFLASSLEQHELRRNKFMFTRIFGFLGIITVIVLMFFPKFALIITYIAFPTAILMIMQYGNILVKRSRGLHRILYPSISLIIGLLLFTAGFIFSVEAMINIFGWWIRLLGDILQCLSVFLFATTFYFLPSISELDWLTKVQTLYVIHPSGLSLYQYQFREKNTLEADLTTSVIVTIKAMFQEMIANPKEGVRSIRRENFTIVLTSGKYIISVIIADDDSISLHEKNQVFCNAFEDTFAEKLQTWNGDVKPFEETEALVKEIFTTRSQPSTENNNSQNGKKKLHRFRNR